MPPADDVQKSGARLGPDAARTRPHGRPRPALNDAPLRSRVAGIPAFFISFVLAPLASNASELIAAMNYASKKTKTSITTSLNTLEGAAIMNNTFCPWALR